MRPAASMVEVRRLIFPDILVEIEADAYVGSYLFFRDAPKNHLLFHPTLVPI